MENSVSALPTQSKSSGTGNSVSASPTQSKSSGAGNFSGNVGVVVLLLLLLWENESLASHLACQKPKATRHQQLTTFSILFMWNKKMRAILHIACRKNMRQASLMPFACLCGFQPSVQIPAASTWDSSGFSRPSVPLPSSISQTTFSVLIAKFVEMGGARMSLFQNAWWLYMMLWVTKTQGRGPMQRSSSASDMIDLIEASEVIKKREEKVRSSHKWWHQLNESGLARPLSCLTNLVAGFFADGHLRCEAFEVVGLVWCMLWFSQPSVLELVECCFDTA